MAYRFISNVASNGFIVGNDSNDGLTPQTAWLTANKLEDAAAAGADVMFNDGTYTKTTDGGRYLQTSNIKIVSYSENFATTLIFSGTSSGDGFRTSGTAGSTFEVGRINITTAGGFKTIPLNLRGPSAGSGAQSVIRLACRVLLENVASAFGAVVTGRNISLTLLDGFGFSGSIGTTVHAGALVWINSGAFTGTDAFNFDCQSCTFDITAGMTTGRGGIYLSSNNTWAGTVAVRGVKGQITGTQASSRKIYGVFIENAPNDAIIENNNDLHLTSGPGGDPLYLFQIAGTVVTCNRPVIRNNIRNLLTGTGGVCAALGDEGGSTHLIVDGVIEDNETTVTNPSVSTTTHGVCSFYCSGRTIRRRNKVTGVNVGTLTKMCAALSQDNVVAHPMGTNAEALYAKGASAGSQFINDVVVVSSANPAAVIESALWDPPSTTVSSGVEFRGTKVTTDDSAVAMTGLLTWIGIGAAGDTSTATSFGMAVDPKVTPANLLVSIGVGAVVTTYATMALANGSDSIEGMAVATLRDLPSLDFLAPSIGVPMISPQYGIVVPIM